MLVFILALLIIWVILAIIGFVAKGLIWLAIIGIVLFAATSVIGFIRRKALRR